MNNQELMDWLFTRTTPQIICVFLGSQGLNGDTNQVVPENNGPA
ncbi:hypothetical protein Slin_5002 [Spirosoma linguale DSM 74]|uniref:Uncharacterized protein n=1 Tax=Spirosoma linguale (strain ATCC 33905 / DSM 74 / LMG 10896 / Claus 1) TaxID=504472 RepID=D2QCX3_SPILD|nr:hypothetical protein Slin_5002 [Spirosoma linguale DSM 74]